MDTSEEIQALQDYFLEKYDAGDYVETVKTLKKLSDLGDVDSSNLLGTMYRYGEDGVEQDTIKALEYYTKGKDWSSIADIYYRGAPNVEKNMEKASLRIFYRLPNGSDYQWNLSCLGCSACLLFFAVADRYLCGEEDNSFFAEGYPDHCDYLSVNGLRHRYSFCLQSRKYSGAVGYRLSRSEAFPRGRFA